jgi:predicted DCC family thiol-disulfide oxidoreductase YuxK
MMDSPIVFFDGVCGLCNSVVDWTLRHDPEGRLKFATLQGETAARLLSVNLRDDLSTIVVIKSETTLLRSSAVAAILQTLGGGWGLCAKLILVFPEPLRDFFYNLIAANRYRLFSKYETCRVPTAAERARFLP